MEKMILKRAEVKEVMGLSLANVDKLINRKTDPMPTIRVGRRILIPVDGFKAWLARQSGTNVNA